MRAAKISNYTPSSHRENVTHTLGVASDSRSGRAAELISLLPRASQPTLFSDIISIMHAFTFNVFAFKNYAARRHSDGLFDCGQHYGSVQS